MDHESGFFYAPEEVQREWGELMHDIDEGASKLGKETWEHFTPEFLDTQSQGFDVQEAIDISKGRRDLYQREKIGQLEGHVQIETDLPITPFHIGDIHWGSIFTNQDLWLAHKDRILKTPGAYVIFYHNLVDNAIPGKFPNNILNNTVPPDVQFKVMQTWIKELDDAGKVLGAIEGDCHEGWSWQAAGVSASNLLYGYEGRKFPVLENGGILNLDLIEPLPDYYVDPDGQVQKSDKRNAHIEKYGIGLWHKQGPFNSHFNPEHSIRQNRRLYHEGETDIEVAAHNHIAAASASYVGSKGSLRPVYYLRVGTYKGVPTVLGEREFVTDKFPIDRRGISGEPPAPSTTLWPNVHRIDSSLDFDTGMEKHLALRTEGMIKKMGLWSKFAKLIGGT